MLARFFIRPLELDIDSKAYRFYSTHDFEFSLVGRTTVPVNKVFEMFHHSKTELRNEAIAIGKAENKILEVLSLSIDNPGTTRRSLKDLDYHIFSHDHDWRNIIITLINKHDEYIPLMRIALLKYTQYLASRRELISTMYLLNSTYKSKKVRKSSWGRAA